MVEPRNSEATVSKTGTVIEFNRADPSPGIETRAPAEALSGQTDLETLAFTDRFGLRSAARDEAREPTVLSGHARNERAVWTPIELPPTLSLSQLVADGAERHDDMILLTREQLAELPAAITALKSVFGLTISRDRILLDDMAPGQSSGYGFNLNGPQQAELSAPAHTQSTGLLGRLLRVLGAAA